MKHERERKLRIRRFEKIIDFLENLPKEKFRFDTTINKFDTDNNCGSICCVVGWFPAIFKEHFYWSYNDVMVRNKNDDETAWEYVEKFLGIDEQLSQHFFNGKFQMEGYDIIPYNASKHQVLKHIKKSVEGIKQGDFDTHLMPITS